MTTCAIYSRLSSDPQGTGLGVERQEAECRDLAARLGLEVGQVYIDNDLSATTGVRRPGFEALLADRPEQVVVWHSDRLVRTPRDLERVLDAGMVVHQVTAGTLDLATSTGRAVARTITAWAAYEGEHKSERQRAANRQRAAKGTPGWSFAFGYSQDGQQTADAALVRQAYEDVLAGRTLAQIARDWAEAGTTSPLGNPWRHTSVRAVLKAARNAGLRTYHGQVVGKGAWDPIVPEGTWQAVQAVLADPSRRTGGGTGPGKALLTGIATCARCGQGMVSGWQGQVRTYRCVDSHLAAPADLLEAVVQEAVEAHQSHAAPADGPTFRHYAQSPALARLGAQADELRDRLAEVSAAYSSGAIPLAVLTAASADIEDRLAANLAEIQQVVETTPPTYTGPSGWAAQTPEERRVFLRGWSVVVHPVGKGKRRTPESIEVTSR